MSDTTGTIERVTDPTSWGRYAKAAEKLDAVIAEVIRLGRTYPGYVYQKPPGTSSCFYNKILSTAETPEEITGCIIGTALRNLGYTIGEQWENHNADHVVCVVLKLPGSIVGAVETSSTMLFNAQMHEASSLSNIQQRALFWRLVWLTGVQRGQDLGKTWGSALSVSETPGYKYPWRPLELS